MRECNAAGSVIRPKSLSRRLSGGGEGVIGGSAAFPLARGEILGLAFPIAELIDGEGVRSC